MLVHSAQELAILVRSQRKKLKLSQFSVGNLVGLKQKTISAFESKPESTKLETLFQILAAVNLEVRVIPRNEKHSGVLEWDQEW